MKKMIHSEVNNINVPTFIQRNYIFFIKKHVPTLYLFFPHVLTIKHQGSPGLPGCPSEAPVKSKISSPWLKETGVSPKRLDHGVSIVEKTKMKHGTYPSAPCMVYLPTKLGDYQGKCW